MRNPITWLLYVILEALPWWAEALIPVALSAVFVWLFGTVAFAHLYLTLATGSALALAFAAVIAGLDEYPELISLDYREYRDAVEILTLGAYLGWGVPVVVSRRPDGVTANIEWVIARLVTAVGSWLLALWAILIAPLIWPVYVVTGAPSRVAARSRQVSYRLRGSWVTERNETGEVPEGAREFSITKKPVAFTSTLTAAILWIIAQRF